jgi:quinol-cytochrome oxidoreductase complex cytochrome b subunit
MSELTKHEAGESIPFFPDHVRTEALVVVGILVVGAVVGTLGLLNPVGTGDPADPMVTPAHVKPEWYFLALYQILKFVPEGVGVMLPLIGLVVVALWPFLDKRRNSQRAQRIRLIAVAAFVVIFIALTIWGEVS